MKYEIRIEEVLKILTDSNLKSVTYHVSIVLKKCECHFRMLVHMYFGFNFNTVSSITPKLDTSYKKSNKLTNNGTSPYFTIFIVSSIRRKLFTVPI